MATGPTRQSDRRAAHVQPPTRRRRRSPRRPTPPRAIRAAALGAAHRGRGGRGRGSRLHRLHDAGEAWPPAAVPPNHLWYAHRTAARTVAGDGRRSRDRRYRSRSRLHLEMGCAALAETLDCRPPTDHRSPRREGGDRTARPRAPDPATDGTAPATPERCGRASDRPGQTRHPKTRGNPPPRGWNTDTIREPTRTHERGQPGDPTPFGAAHRAKPTSAQCLGTVG